MIVFIDSNIIRSDQKISSSGMQAISYYSRIGLIEVYMPETVRDEIISNNQDFTDGAINKISETLSSLKKIGLSDEGFRSVGEIDALIDKSRLQLNLSINERFLKWISDNDITVHPISESSYRKTMQAYFSGSPPFNKRREKEHIPDALIYFSLLEFTKENEDVYFLSNDINLSKHVGNNICKSFSRADELISSEEFRRHLEDNIFDCESNIIGVFSNAIKKHPRPISSKILYKLSDSFLDIAEIGLSSLAGTNPQINELQNVAVTHISPNSLTLLPSGELSIDFFASVEISVSYVAHQSTFEIYDFGEREIEVEFQGDNAVVQEILTLEAKGKISIPVNTEDWSGVLYHERSVQRIIEKFDITEINCSADLAVEEKYFNDFEWLDVTADYEYDQDDDVYKTDLILIDKAENTLNLPEDDDLPF